MRWSVSPLSTNIARCSLYFGHPQGLLRAHNAPPTHTMAPSTHTIAPPTHRIALLMTIQYLGIQLAHNRTHIIKRMHVNCYQTTVSGCSLSAMHSIIGYHPIAKWILQMQIWMNCCPFG